MSGRGETFKSGGRVVKNVTGYDLCKLMAGSWGTLAALTEVTIKTLPKPETEETVLMCGLDRRGRDAAMAAAMGSPCEVSGAAHLPAAVAARFPVGAIAGAGAALTAMRLEGVAPSVAQRKAHAGGGAAALRRTGRCSTSWARAHCGGRCAMRRRLRPAASDNARPLWRISTAAEPRRELAARITAQVRAQMLYDWAGGLSLACARGKR